MPNVLTKDVCVGKVDSVIKTKNGYVIHISAKSGRLPGVGNLVVLDQDVKKFTSNKSSSLMKSPSGVASNIKLN